jgi:hypothetical protein
MTTANGSTRQNQISNGYTFTTGRWYFLTLGFNNTYNWFRFMAWDSVANSFVYTRSNVIAGGSIYVGPGNFNICGWTGYVGNIDEVVVLDYCANMEEVKDIIDQSYPVARNNVASDPACKAYYSFPWPYPHEPTIGPWLDPLNQYQVAYPSEVADKAGYCDARVLTTDYYYGYSVETENQPTGWPFKPGESTRVGTFCIWFKPQIGQADATLVGHWMEGTIPYRSWCILPGDSTQNCRVKLAHSSTAYETQDTGWRPTDNQYYLYMVAIDGTTNKTVRIKIWGKTENAVVYSGTLDFANKTQLYLGHTTWPFFVGATVPYSWFRPAGWIGSLAVFNRLLSDAEMDAYIAGTFVFASAPADCRSATDCEALLPVPDGIWSETTCEDVHDLTPDDARSLTTCEGVLVSLEECVSLSTCEDITLPRPDDCRSITYCPITAGGQPNAAISLTRCQALPLTYGEGTFMVF